MSKNEIKIEKYIGKRMSFNTTEGVFEGTVSGTIWIGAMFIELENPFCMFNGNKIIYGIEIIDEEN